MKKVKSSVLSARDFFQLTVNSLLELCTNCIDGHRIDSIEGRLLLTLDTGDKVELNILQQDVSSALKSTTADDNDVSSSSEVSNMESIEKLDCALPVKTEAGLKAEGSGGLQSISSTHVKKADTSLENEREKAKENKESCTDEGSKRIPDVNSMPSAVLQTNGEFVCSSCGEVMKCARTIKRHISMHISLGHSTVSCVEPVNNKADKSKVTQKWPKKHENNANGLRKPNTNTDSGGKAMSNKDGGKQWRSYSCKDCGDVFTSSPLLQLHRVNTHRPHQCQKCGMVLMGRRNFAQHVRNEHPGLHICKAQKSFVCEYCSRTFHDESLLKDHISTVHLGTVEHRCDQCGKVLGSAATLIIHQRQLHERRFQQTCDGCGRQFTRLAGLINHLTRTHPHLLPEKYRRRLEEYACSECDLRFLRPSTLQHHIEVRHGGAPKYMCHVCLRRFTCRRYVFRHVRIHHPGAAKTNAVKRVDIGNDASSSVSVVRQPPTDVSSAVQQ